MGVLGGFVLISLLRVCWRLRVVIFIKSVSRMGVKKGGTWRTLRVPDGRL